MVATKQKMTLEEFAAITEDGRFDLIDGELYVSPANFGHGSPVSRATIALGNFVYARNLGELVSGEDAFVLGPGNAVCPDVAFVRTERLPPPDYVGFFQGPPDLAVEVISPSESRAMVARKVARYLEAGTPIVWCVYQDTRQVVDHRPGREPVTLGIDGVLDGGDVLPGFTLPVRSLFPERR